MCGSKKELARRLGITPMAVSKWKTIPYGRVRDVEKVTGVPKEKLTPELYRD